MKTLLVLTTTVLSLAVLTGCKKETYGDPMKFAQKYLRESLDDSSLKVNLFNYRDDRYLKDMMKTQGYTGFEILNAQLSSSPFGEEIIECSIGIKTSGEHSYYKFCSKIRPWDFTRGYFNSREIGYGLSESIRKEPWVLHLAKINKEYLMLYQSISELPTFTARVARRQVDGVYVPVHSVETSRGSSRDNMVWKFDHAVSLSTNWVITSKQFKSSPHNVAMETVEKEQAFNTLSQRFVRAKAIITEYCEAKNKLFKAEEGLKWYTTVEKVREARWAKSREEKKEALQAIEEIKKRALTL